MKPGTAARQSVRLSLGLSNSSDDIDPNLCELGKLVVSLAGRSIMKDTFAVLNQMHADGVIGRYAIGGAVGATFYLEPVATLDVDVFVVLSQASNSPLITLEPLYHYLLPRGYMIEGEYIIIGDWPVQFLPPSGPLEEEAIEQSAEQHVDGIPVWVMTAEHLVCIALRLGRAKDFARILQFIEAGVLDTAKLEPIMIRHGLLDKWENFEKRFLNPDNL